MTDLYFAAINDDTIRENLNIDEDIEYRFVDKWRNTEYTIFFTKSKAAWIAKYKGEYYGQAVENIVEQDKYTLIDVFKTLRENAIDTLKAV